MAKMSKPDKSNSSGSAGGQQPTKELSRDKLPDALQKIVDDDDSLMDQIYDGRCVLKNCPIVLSQ